MSGQIYGIGETVYDIIFTDGVISGGCPGGSVLNSMISLGRLGVPAVFISEFGKDKAGDLINNFLNVNKIDTSLIRRYNEGKTILALAFQENGRTDYDFYRIEPSHPNKLTIPEFTGSDIFLFGSFYSIMPPKRSNIEKMVTGAVNARSMIIYDPNFRRPHLRDLPNLKPNIISNIEYADIIRGSDEDFYLIFGTENVEDTSGMIGFKILIYTMGAYGTWLCTPNFKKHYPARKVEPISTIGAGDGFNAAIAYSLHKLEISKSELINLNESDWDCIINTGLEFSRKVCLSKENYIDQAFADGFDRNFNNFYKLFRK